MFPKPVLAAKLKLLLFITLIVSGLLTGATETGRAEPCRLLPEPENLRGSTFPARAALAGTDLPNTGLLKTVYSEAILAITSSESAVSPGTTSPGAISASIVKINTTGSNNSLPPVQTSFSRQIENAGIGFSYQLPAGWNEVSPMLMELYNTAGQTLGEGQGTPYLIAAYSAAGSRFIPPVVLLLFLEQPITAGMVDPLNNLFIEEAKDQVGKTALARKLNLASEVRFIETRELRPQTPLVIAEADTSFGFTIRIMASPFYTDNGLIVAAYFAPLDDYEQYEAEMLGFFRSISINQDKIPG